MRPEKNYLKVWKDLKEKSSDKPRLSDFVNALEVQEIHQFLLDVFEEDITGLSKIFNASRNSSIANVAFDQLVDLPFLTLNKISEQLGIIYSKALNQQLKNNEIVRKKILAITAINKIGLSKKYIIRKVEDSRLKKIQKLELLLVLSALEDTVGMDYWMTKINIKEEPHLAPVLVSVLKKVDPIKAFSILAQLDDIFYVPEPEILVAFKQPVRSTIYLLLKDMKEKLIEKYVEIVEEFKLPWIKEMIKDILKHPKFEYYLKEMTQMQQLEKGYSNVVVGDILGAPIVNETPFEGEFEKTYLLKLKNRIVKGSRKSRISSSLKERGLVYDYKRA